LKISAIPGIYFELYVTAVSIELSLVHQYDPVLY